MTQDDRSIRKPDDIVDIFGPVQGDPSFSAWRVRLRSGAITTVAVTNSSSETINITIAEYHDVFGRLANE